MHARGGGIRSCASLGQFAASLLNLLHAGLLHAGRGGVGRGGPRRLGADRGGAGRIGVGTRLRLDGRPRLGGSPWGGGRGGRGDGSADQRPGSRWQVRGGGLRSVIAGWTVPGGRKVSARDRHGRPAGQRASRRARRGGGRPGGDGARRSADQLRPGPVGCLPSGRNRVGPGQSFWRGQSSGRGNRTVPRLRDDLVRWPERFDVVRHRRPLTWPASPVGMVVHHYSLPSS